MISPLFSSFFLSPPLSFNLTVSPSLFIYLFLCSSTHLFLHPVLVCLLVSAFSHSFERSAQPFPSTEAAPPHHPDPNLRASPPSHLLFLSSSSSTTTDSFRICNYYARLIEYWRRYKYTLVPPTPTVSFHFLYLRFSLLTLFPESRPSTHQSEKSLHINTDALTHEKGTWLDFIQAHTHAHSHESERESYREREGERERFRKRDREKDWVRERERGGEKVRELKRTWMTE